MLLKNTRTFKAQLPTNFYMSPFIAKGPIILIAVRFQIPLNATSVVSEVAQEQSLKVCLIYVMLLLI